APRPSLTWQAWQDRALNNGPSPSDAWVDDGDDTQSLRNNPLPTKNSWRASKLRLAAGCEKMSGLIRLVTVPAPPCMASKRSADEKSRAGRTTSATRARSWSDKSGRGAAASPALAGPHAKASTQAADRA